jgi:glycosyltransferase involved in cell wall biosynthesis
VVLEEGWERGVASPVTRWVSYAEDLRLRHLYRAIGRSPHHIVTISEIEREDFTRWIPRERITSIPLGLDLTYWSRSGEPAEDIDVLIVGKLNRPEQRVVELVHALRADVRTAQVRIAIVGGDLTEDIRNLSADSLIEIPGHVPDVRPWYERSRLAAVPSFLVVGVKSTILQAWAMQVPVVAPDSVMRVLGAHGAASVEDMVDGIARLLQSRSMRHDEGLRGRSRVESHFEASSRAREFAAIVESVLQG